MVIGLITPYSRSNSGNVFLTDPNFSEEIYFSFNDQSEPDSPIIEDPYPSVRADIEIGNPVTIKIILTFSSGGYSVEWGDLGIESYYELYSHAIYRSSQGVVIQCLQEFSKTYYLGDLEPGNYSFGLLILPVMCCFYFPFSINETSVVDDEGDEDDELLEDPEPAPSIIPPSYYSKELNLTVILFSSISIPSIIGLSFVIKRLKEIHRD